MLTGLHHQHQITMDFIQAKIIRQLKFTRLLVVQHLTTDQHRITTIIHHQIVVHRIVQHVYQIIHLIHRLLQR